MKFIIVLLLFINIIKSEYYNNYYYDSSNISPNDISTLIDNIVSNCSSNLNSNCFGTEWGIIVDSYNSNTGEFTNLYSLNELQAFTPASNTKLFTTLTIFYTFGEDFKVSTPFYTDKPYEPNQDFDYLCVKGMGDPSITIEQIEQAATFFSKSNSIKHLILDNSFYINNGDPVPQSWEWEDLTSTYGAIPTPLMIDENTMYILINPSSQVGEKPVVSFIYPGQDKYLQVINNAITGSNSDVMTIGFNFKISSNAVVISGVIPQNSNTQSILIPILDPEQYFLTVFSSMLAEKGLNVESVSIGSCNDTSYDYRSFVIESPELSSMLNYTLLTSDNLYAETFLRLLGTFNANTSLPSNTPTDQRGLKYIQSILGIQDLLYTQVDGSGLSRQNFITPKSLISIVEGSYTNVGDPNHDFISYLPVSGVSGTLARRFINTPAQGIVHAKTGSMTGVHSLTGLIARDGLHNNNPTQPILFFSIIANNSPSQDKNIISFIDQIIILLSQLQF